MTADVFETKPRWPGAPKICLYENLPAFATVADLKEFQETCGSAGILEQWKCQRCGCWHYIAEPVAPAGGSSGTKRAYTHKPPQYRRNRP